MTNEEYQQLFPWNEFTIAARDGRLAVSFGERPIPLSFKIGEVVFESRAATRYATHYVSQSGIVLTLQCPHPQPYRTQLQALFGHCDGALSDVGMWVAHKEGPFYPSPRYDTPMQALKALQDWLLQSALRGQQDRRDHDIVSAMLTGK